MGNKDIGRAAKSILTTGHQLSMESCLDWEAPKDSFGELCPKGEAHVLVDRHLQQES